MNENSIETLVIVGGGTAGWMAAAGIKSFFNNNNIPIKITLVESEAIPPVGVGEASLPGLKTFNQSVGIDEIEFIKKTQATFKLAIQFKDWHKKDSLFFHPFSKYGTTINDISFHHYWMKDRFNGSQHSIQDYSLSVAMCQLKSFSPPDLDTNNPLSEYKYAYHFDAGLYARLLKEHSLKLGVERIEGKINSTRLRENDGFIESVILEGGYELSADLFVDCSGFKGLLIEDALNTGYTDWSNWLLCDRAIAIQTSSSATINPYTTSRALDAGWSWHIPLQNRIGNGYVYSSQFVDNQYAQETLIQTIEGKVLKEPKLLTFTPGMRKKFWNKNCVALGLASGFIEPLESTSISLIQSGIIKLLMLFPDKTFKQALIDEANRLAQEEFERIRDFIILHYKATQREDAELWRFVKNMSIPDSLSHKIEMYKEKGVFVKYLEESFTDESWLTIYSGFGIYPKKYDVRVDGVNSASLSGYLKNMRNALNDAAKKSIPHIEFIEKIYS